MFIVNNKDTNVTSFPSVSIAETLLFELLLGDSNSNKITNTLILNATINFLIATKRFDASVL